MKLCENLYIFLFHRKTILNFKILIIGLSYNELLEKKALDIVQKAELLLNFSETDFENNLN